MKKFFIIILSLIAMALILYLVFFYSLGAPFDADQSPYIEMEPPENLARTIHNPLAGHYTTFLAKSHETNGEYTLLEIELEPGGENSPHYHNDFSETFTGVSGTTGVHVNGENFYLNEGETVTAEAGDVHYFFNDTDEVVTFQVRIEPGSPGFEKGLYILYGLANDGMTDEAGTPDDIAHIAVFVAYTNTRGTGPLRVFNPLFSRMAGKAQRDGVESELIERYYFSMIEEPGTPDEEETAEY